MSFRGLLRHLNAELLEHPAEGFVRLELVFDTLDSHTGEPIRFSLTRAYATDIPHGWCVADLCEYAMLHEVQEAVPALFREPDHRPGVLDRHEEAQVHAEKSRVRYQGDVASGRWRDESMGDLKPVW